MRQWDGHCIEQGGIPYLPMRHFRIECGEKEKSGGDGSRIGVNPPSVLVAVAKMGEIFMTDYTDGFEIIHKRRSKTHSQPPISFPCFAWECRLDASRPLWQPGSLCQAKETGVPWRSISLSRQGKHRGIASTRVRL